MLFHPFWGCPGETQGVEFRCSVAWSFSCCLSPYQLTLCSSSRPHGLSVPLQVIHVVEDLDSVPNFLHHLDEWVCLEHKQQGRECITLDDAVGEADGSRTIVPRPFVPERIFCSISFVLWIFCPLVSSPPFFCSTNSCSSAQFSRTFDPTSIRFFQFY